MEHPQVYSLSDERTTKMQQQLEQFVVCKELALILIKISLMEIMLWYVSITILLETY